MTPSKKYTLQKATLPLMALYKCGNFNILIAQRDECYNIWLQDAEDGMAKYMFDLPTDVVSHEDCLKIIEANLKTYINIYAVEEICNVPEGLEYKLTEATMPRVVLCTCDEFNILVVEGDEYYDAWLQCDDYGVGHCMFGLPKDTVNLDECLKIVEANLEAYIRFYFIEAY